MGGGIVTIYDISNTASPVEAGFVQVAGSVTDVAIDGDTLYVTDRGSGSHGLYSFDLDDSPASPEALDAETNSEYNSTDPTLTIAGDYAIAVGGNEHGPRIFNVSDPGGTRYLTDLPLAPDASDEYPVPRGACALGSVLYSFDVNDGGSFDDVGLHQYFVGPGLSVRHCITKAFEVGGDAFAAPALTLFPDLLPEVDGTTTGVQTYTLLVGGALILSLNPAYNLSVDISPALRYQTNPGRYIDGTRPSIALTASALESGLP